MSPREMFVANGMNVFEGSFFSFSLHPALGRMTRLNEAGSSPYSFALGCKVYLDIIFLSPRAYSSSALFTPEVSLHGMRNLWCNLLLFIRFMTFDEKNSLSPRREVDAYPLEPRPR